MNTFPTSETSSAAEIQEVIKNGPFPIRFPPKGLPQDEEWCEVQVDGEWRRVRFHDYREVYKVPGLYETIFYRTLRCNSPNRVSALLNDVLVELGFSSSAVRALDFGAGNGMSGEALQSLGIRKIVGIDVLKEAEIAVMRDRPWVYDHFIVDDLSEPSEENFNFLKNYQFNVLTTVAALGFADIPPLAFFNAFNLIEDGGIIAFNIRDILLSSSGGSPFARVFSRMMEHEIVRIELLKRYQHRLDIRGNSIPYVGVIAVKNRAMPREIFK